MPKRSRKAPRDYGNAARLVAIAPAKNPGKPRPKSKPEPKKNPHAVALGRQGGKVVGKAGETLTAEDRRSIVVKAARARWGMSEDE